MLGLNLLVLIKPSCLFDQDFNTYVVLCSQENQTMLVGVVVPYCVLITEYRNFQSLNTQQLIIDYSVVYNAFLAQTTSVHRQNLDIILTTFQGAFYETQEQLWSDALPVTTSNFYWIQTQNLLVTNNPSALTIIIFKFV